MRLQVHLAAKGDCALADHVIAEAKLAKSRLPDARVIGLVQQPDDQFPLANPLCRPYEAVLEVESDSAAAGALEAAVADIGDRLAAYIHADLSGVLIGTPHRIISCAGTPVRYLYLMRRRHDHTREQYYKYYFENHSRFGHRTPGIAGYTQFHVDDRASSAAARRLGFGMWGADSVSELYLESTAAFFAALAPVPELAVEAAQDEARFVDRTNSKSFVTDTVIDLP